jgi:hypothetical protein
MVLCAILFFQGSALADTSKGEKIIATVNGVAITERQVSSEYARLLPRTAFHQSLDESKQAALRSKAFDNLVEKELKIQDARELGLKIDKKEVDQELERLISKYPSKKVFKERLEKSGFAMKDVVNEIERRKLAESAYQNQVIDQVHVTEADARSYYDANKETFVLPVRYRLRNILIKVPPLANSFEKKTLEDKANEVAAKVKEGMPFEEAVEKYSEGKEKEKGGDMGFLHKGQTAIDGRSHKKRDRGALPGMDGRIEEQG